MKSIDTVHDSGFSTPSLDRALSVLECLSCRKEGLTQSEIAIELGLSANFVYRTTLSLTAHGYLTRDANKRFRLSGKLMRLSQPVLDDVPLTEAALPAMRWLSEQTGEASHLGILDGDQGLVIERVIGSAPIKFYVERGTRFPLHTSGPGKCMLAFAPQEERNAILEILDFEAYHPWTISNRTDFEACLKKTGEEGFATDLGEHLEGHHCLGVPVLDSTGNAVAGLWITGPSQRLSEERIVKLVPIIIEAGKMASGILNREVIV